MEKLVRDTLGQVQRVKAYDEWTTFVNSVRLVLDNNPAQFIYSGIVIFQRKKTAKGSCCPVSTSQSSKMRSGRCRMPHVCS